MNQPNEQDSAIVNERLVATLGVFALGALLLCDTGLYHWTSIPMAETMAMLVTCLVIFTMARVTRKESSTKLNWAHFKFLIFPAVVFVIALPLNTRFIRHIFDAQGSQVGLGLQWARAYGMILMLACAYFIGFSICEATKAGCSD